MRRALFFLLVFGIVSIVSAQENDQRGPGRGPGTRPGLGRNFQFRNQCDPSGFCLPNAENISVSGNLAIARGTIAVTANGITYLTLGLNRLTGFIDGFQEGAHVTLDGHTIPFPGDNMTKFLHVKKMTFNGTEYDMGIPFLNTAPRLRPRYL